MSLLQEIKVLKEIADDDYTTVIKTYFKTADKVKKGDAIIELQTSKAAFTIEAEKEGYIEYLCNEGEDVFVGAVIIKIYDKAEDIKTAKKTDTPAKETANTTLFSASALKLIEKEKLDKNIFSEKDFVGVEDVYNFIKSGHKLKHNTGKESASHELKELIDSKQVNLQKITKGKEIEILALKDVQSANMNCVIAISVDTGNIFRFAENNLSILKDSLSTFVIFEVSRLLKRYPEFNAFFTEGNIAFYNAVNIGLAIDLGDGLKVVKLANADKKNIKEIEMDILQAADKYLDKKLTMDDISGITFTISDLSKEDVHFFIPLINKQQSAILGISGTGEKPDRCIFTLTFDHRVTEGKKASEFLNELKRRLENNYINHGSGVVDNIASHKAMSCCRCLMTLEEIRQFNGAGLLKIIDCEGNEKFLCTTCFLGWT